MKTDPSLVLLSARLGPVTDEERRLKAHGARVRSAGLLTTEDIARNAQGASFILLGSVEPFGAAAFGALPGLLAVIRRGVGVDNIDLAAATAHGVIVANVPDSSVEEVSDHALALLLGCERRIVPLDRAVRSGEPDRQPATSQRICAAARRLRDLRLGVVGLGRIGRALARKAACVYGEIIGSDPYMAADAVPGVRLVPLAELLASADHVSLHAPMTAGNRHLIGAAELALMKPGAVLVNTARGGLVDEAALLDALMAGRLSRAALDVTQAEPVGAGSPLLHQADRLLLTGHAAAWGTASARELRVLSVDAVAALLDGGLPSSVVNPDVMTSPRLRIPRPHLPAAAGP